MKTKSPRTIDLLDDVQSLHGSIDEIPNMNDFRIERFHAKHKIGGGSNRSRMF
jgi:hypothetical protein